MGQPLSIVSNMVSLVRLLKLFVKPSNRREYWWGYYWNAAVFFGHVWQLETAHRTVCHFVCLWPAFFPSPICCLLSHVWQRNGTRCGVPFRVPLAGFVLCGFEGYIFIFAISCCGAEHSPRWDNLFPSFQIWCL